MEEQRSNRPSGLPRPSRLPIQPSKLPKPAAPAAPPSLRHSVSRDTLPTGVSSLRNPKLRSTASRDQLASSTTSLRPQATTPSRAVSSPHTRTPVGQNTPIALRNTAKSPNVASQGLGRTVRQPAARLGHTGSLSRSLNNKPPAQGGWISAPILDDQENVLEQSLEADEVDEAVVLPSELPESEMDAQTARPATYKSRPSLSERTIETLSKLPSSPAVKGRGAASFYESESTRRRALSRPGSRASRPGSSHQSDGSNRPPSRTSSRPGSSSGVDENAASAKTPIGAYKNPLSTINDSPLRGRSSLQSLKTPSTRTTAGSTFGSSTSKMPPPGFNRSKTPSPDKAPNDVPLSRYASKTLTARPLKQRPSLNGLFRKPSMSGLDRAGSAGATRKTSTASQRSSATSCETDPSIVTSASTAMTNDSTEVATYRKTSAALRDQIAKAKAARKAAARQATAPGTAEIPTPERSPLIPTDNTFDFGLQSDPFNQRGDEKSLAKVLQGRLTTARTSGRLNIAALNLREIPADVMNMYNLESVGGNDGSWAESVDLTRFVAADNELEMIEDSVFPDVDPQDYIDEDDSQGNIFGGLETLDLHGNMLIALPMGLRRLERLTSLNLSQNRLANNCLEVISQIKALKDLKLGGNLLYGPLDPCFSSLQNLEILDLHGNNIASLPSNFGNLSHLRILNISENVFETVPFEIFAEMPLTELVARKNQLSGTLIPDSVSCLPALQTLDVSANQLVQLTSPGKSCDMPALSQLLLSMNRLQSLPDITDWKNLFVLSADENSINAIPEGFTKLDKLRSVDFSSNDIRVIPAEIGLMDNLSMLRLSGNPLRDKKFCSATTDDLKSILAQRLEPPLVHPEVPSFFGQTDTVSTPVDTTGQLIATAVGVDEDDDDLDDFATPPTSAPVSPTRSRSHTLTGQTWPVKAGGILDRSQTESTSLHPVVCSKVAASHKIRDIQLQQNLFTTLPDSLSFFADTLVSLSLAKNQLLGEEYLTEDLELPALKELNLSDNKITSLVPLISHLQAPNLVKIDASLNRIASLPQGHLRDIFPKLEILLISNNHLDDLEPESIKGLRIVNASNNDIAHLNPRLGLLGLETLEVTGNRFRVPKWNVLDRGTEATLRWLRSRVPLAEMAEWREQEGHGDDVD